MTIVLNDRRARYVASGGQTSFDVDFPIDTDADVAVYHKVDATGVITLLTLTTDYTVTLDGAAPNTADVDLVVGAAVNDIITIEGETSPARDTDFTTGGDYFAGTVNNAEDRQYRIDQETKRDRDRTVVANRVSPDTFDPTLPDVVGEALKTVRINAAETAFEFTEPTGQGPQGETGATGADGDMTNPMTARGDLITGDAGGPGDPQRLAVGAANTYLKSDGTDPAWGTLDIVDDTTPQQGGAHDTNAFSIHGSEGAPVAAAAQPNIWAGDGSTLHITGNTQIDDFTDAPRIGAWAKLIFDGTPQLTSGSGITVVGGTQTMEAGDIAFVYADAVDAFRAFILKADGTAVTGGAGGMTLGTEQDTSSGTAFTFGSIPAGTVQIIISFNEVGLSGTDNIIVTIGDSGGLETSGYTSTTFDSVGGVASSTAGWIINDGTQFSGQMVLTLVDDDAFTWASTHEGKVSTTIGAHGGGSKSLTAELTQLQITRTGTDTFDNGSVNIMYQ